MNLASKLELQRDALPSDSQDALLARGKVALERTSEALRQLASTLSDEFALSVHRIVDTSRSGNTVIFSGVGKAGIIASKLSATFASVGIPSFFLHPTEAFHGDFGRVTEGDTLVLCSYSGRTKEVLRLVPHLRERGARMLALTEQVGSPLGSLCDAVLPIGPVEETCPLGLAPTTSTTCMLALGDALAVAAMELLQTDAQVYSSLHPGGSLGHGLIPLSEIMRTGDSHCVVEETLTTQQVLKEIVTRTRRAGAASVVAADGTLRGIFTDGDLRRRLAEDPLILQQPVGDVMSTSPKTVPLDGVVSDALQVMTNHEIDEVIVIDTGSKPVGIVDIQDILKLG